MKATTGTLILSALVFVGALPVAAQQTDVLRLWRDTGFTETRALYGRQRPELVLDLSYNLPHVYDEDYDLILFLRFAHRDSLQPGRTYDVNADSAALRVHSQFLSVWIWGTTPATFSGTVKVLRKSRRKVALGLDLVTTRSSNGNQYRCRGARMYRRSGSRRSTWWSNY